MYHFFKNDPWGNKVPVMSIGEKRVTDECLERHQNLITRIVEVPRRKQLILLM